MSRFGVWIENGSDHALHFLPDDQICARRRAALMIARLEIDVQGGALGLRSGVFDGDNFGVRTACFLVPALADDRLALREHAADARVRRRRIKAFFGKRERPRHHGAVEIGKHAHLRLRRGDLTSCTASRKSSGVSKLRYTEAKRM